MRVLALVSDGEVAIAEASGDEPLDLRAVSRVAGRDAWPGDTRDRSSFEQPGQMVGGEWGLVGSESDRAADGVRAGNGVMPAADLGEGGRAVLSDAVGVEGDAVAPAASGGRALSIASVTNEVRMWSAIDQSTTLLE